MTIFRTPFWHYVCVFCVTCLLLLAATTCVVHAQSLSQSSSSTESSPVSNAQLEAQKNDKKQDASIGKDVKPSEPDSVLNVKPISTLSSVPKNSSDAVKPANLNKAPNTADTSQAIKVVIALTVMAILPSLLISMTAFLRIIIVLSMLRHAIGMQETPPNSALIGIALFLTMFTMATPLQTVNQDAFQPFMAGTINAEVAYERAAVPIRDFMVHQTREQDLALMVELSKAPPPSRIEDISNLQLIPAFMLSELRAAFQIGFVIFLPFLLIDLIVSSVLMALGMMMMPPVSIALPLKILMFILIDGWSLILRALVGSFH